MKFFISHKFTGLSWDDMDVYLGPIRTYLQGQGQEVFCSLYLEDRFKEQGWTTEKIYQWCCEQQDLYDVTLAIFRSDQDSYGMNLELERAKKEGKQYIILYKDGLQNHEWMKKYISQANQIISYSTYEDYLGLLKDNAFLFTS